MFRKCWPAVERIERSCFITSHQVKISQPLSEEEERLFVFELQGVRKSI